MLVFIVQAIIGISLSSVFGIIQYQAAVYSLKKTNFFYYRYKDQCESTLYKVMFFIVVPLTILLLALLNHSFGWSGNFFLRGLAATSFTFFIVLFGVHDRYVENRFHDYFIKRDGRTRITSDVISEPSEEEIKILFSGKRITSKLCKSQMDT